MINLDANPTTRWAIHFLALLGIIAALRYGQLFLVPLVISLMLATALWPAVSYLHKQMRLPRSLAGIIVITGVMGIIILAVVWGGLQLQAIFQQLPAPENWFPRRADAVASTTSEVDETGNDSRDETPTEPVAALDGTQDGAAAARTRPRRIEDRNVYQRIHDRLAVIDLELANQLFPPDPRDSFLYRNVVPVVNQQLQALPRYMTTAAEQILFILFLVLFLCVEGDMLIRRTTEVFGPSNTPDAESVIRALQNMARQVRAYLLWRTFINIGLAVALGFIYKYLLGMSYPWVWAIFAGILTYIPYLGPIIAGVPAVLDALLSPAGGVFSALAVLVILVLVFTLEGYVVFPLVLGRNMEMNATTTLLACLFWWLVWGNIGLFLAMPLMGGIRAICQNVPGWEPWANLMGMDSTINGRRGRLRKAFHLLILDPWNKLRGRPARSESDSRPTETTAEPAPSHKAGEG